MHHFQQDGHMAMKNPKGRANYEPNSLPNQERGPRECPREGFSSFADTLSGEKRRARSASFSDHYSQARQFYVSQTDVEKDHIQDALVFELSKVERAEVRVRMVSHLLNIDESLAKNVARGLGVDPLPTAATPAKAPNNRLPSSDALSILKNSPGTFSGRKVGALITDGVDMDLLNKLRSALSDEGADLELIAPRISGIKGGDGTVLEAGQAVVGGPSVLYDAVVLLPSEKGALELAEFPETRDFVADAFAHFKFIGCGPHGTPLLKAAGVNLDRGVFALEGASSIEEFVVLCRSLRFFERALHSPAE
jgi:catalase